MQKRKWVYEFTLTNNTKICTFVYRVQHLFYGGIMKAQRKFTIIFILCILAVSLSAQAPGKRWQQYQSVEEAGFSAAKLKQAKALVDSLGAAAFMIIYDGKVVASWGDVERRYMCHSVRKSLLSALYGTYVDAGSIDLEKTMAELGIDDKDKLTEEEKKATIHDLLKARSGVYHPAAYETAGMKARRPKRGSHPHNTFWYYNNWDFNTLGYILRLETGVDIFEDFKNRIADPIGMEDYRVSDGYYHLEPENSNFPAYPFRVSARDLARFGLLFLRDGNWNGNQIISRDWVKRSATSYSAAGRRGGYGYLWWISSEFAQVGLYSALGVGSQVIAVIPGANMVLIQRVDTYVGDRVPVSNRLIQMILDAKVSDPKPNARFITLQNESSYSSPPKIQLSNSEVKKYLGKYTTVRGIAELKQSDDGLFFESPSFGTFSVYPVSKQKLFVEDAAQFIVFEKDNEGSYTNPVMMATSEMADFFLDLQEKGIQEAVKYQREMFTQTGKPILGANALNGLGYQFLGIDQKQAALEIFKLAVDLHPQDSNLWDSLGEAYMVSGDFENAIKNYKKSLELNPRNTNATAMIERMTREAKEKEQ